MKSRVNVFAILRRLLAAVSLLAMTAVFFVPAAARWFGWLPRLQLVPAILAGAVLELVVLVILVALFGRLYCSILCPLGILQDLFTTGRQGCRPNGGTAPDDVKGKSLPARSVKDVAETKSARSPFWGKCSVSQIIRYSIPVLFSVSVCFGMTGLIEPYGIFGRFLAVGVRRVGEPATVTVVWPLGLVVLILALTFVRARWWCNRICPVGTFLGLFSRWALFRVRIDADACVKCGACAKQCAKGAFVVRADKSIAIDASSCVVCGNCLATCPKGAISLFRPVSSILHTNQIKP